MDPEHIPAPKIDSLYNHLLGRQRKKLPPFVILNPGPLHEKAATKSEKSKGKMKQAYVEVSTDGEEDKEGDEKDNDGDKEDDEGYEEDDDDVDREGDVVKPPGKMGPPVGIRKNKPQSEGRNGFGGPSKLPTTNDDEVEGEDEEENVSMADFVSPPGKMGPPVGIRKKKTQPEGRTRLEGSSKLDRHDEDLRRSKSASKKSLMKVQGDKKVCFNLNSLLN